MSETKNWTVGWGNGLTGPTTPSISPPCCGGENWKYVPVASGQETIAIVVQQDELHGIEKMHRNANMIAAAPELLEALQFVMSARVEQLSMAFKQAEKAIAKATGEAK